MPTYQGDRVLFGGAWDLTTPTLSSRKLQGFIYSMGIQFNYTATNWQIYGVDLGWKGTGLTTLNQDTISTNCT